METTVQRRPDSDIRCLQCQTKLERRYRKGRGFVAERFCPHPATCRGDYQKKKAAESGHEFGWQATPGTTPTCEVATNVA